MYGPTAGSGGSGSPSGIPGLPKGYSRVGPGGRVKPGYIYSPLRGWMRLNELAAIYGEHAGNSGTPAAGLSRRIGRAARAAGQHPALAPKHNQAARPAPASPHDPPAHSAIAAVGRVASHAAATASKTLNTSAHVRRPAGAGGGGGGGGGGSADPTSGLLAALMAGAGRVGTMIPTSFADQMAGVQYDPQIHDIQVELAKAPRQSAQNLHDIASYYGQVLGSEGKAAAADKAGYEAGKSSLGDAINSIVSSLGGSANAGSASVGAAGADAVGTLGAIESAQNDFNSQLAPILQLEAAGQKSQEVARSNQRLTDLGTQLENLVGSRGQAKAAALADILDKNNALAQTRFSNRAGLLNTLAAMQTAGVRAQNDALNNALKVKKLNAPPPGTFAAASPKSKSAVAQSITQSLLDPSTHQRLSSVPDYHRAAQIAADIVRSNGWAATNPAVIQQIILPALHTAGFYPPPGFFSGRAA